MRVAHIAMTTSPSTIWPFSSMTMSAIRVAVERDADLGAALDHLGAHVVGVERAGLLVDVDAVRLHADRVTLAPSSEKTSGATL